MATYLMYDATSFMFTSVYNVATAYSLSVKNHFFYPAEWLYRMTNGR